jgi:hypothetical protein
MSSTKALRGSRRELRRRCIEAASGGPASIQQKKT